MRWILIGLVKIYSAVISPLWHGLMGPQAGCRFTPGCAQYMTEALKQWGAWRGLGLGLCRVSKCHPWCAGGYDPVPSKKNAEKSSRTHQG